MTKVVFSFGGLPPKGELRIHSCRNHCTFKFRKYCSFNFRSQYVGSDVFVVGYPTSLGIDYLDIFDNDRPVARKGIVSYLNHKKKHIVIDCFAFASNSGGPVVQPTGNSERPLEILGVVSRYVPYRQDYYIANENIRHTNYINSGYAVIVSMDNVIDTLVEFAAKLPVKEYAADFTVDDLF